MASGRRADPDRRFYLNLYPALDAQRAGPGLPYCKDTRPPRSHPVARASSAGRRHVRIAGTASDSGCAGDAESAAREGRVRRVQATFARHIRRGRCRYLRSNGAFAPARSCKRRVWLTAKGAATWHLGVKLAGRLAPGAYTARSRASDDSGNLRGGGGSPAVRFEVRKRGHGHGHHNPH